MPASSRPHAQKPKRRGQRPRQEAGVPDHVACQTQQTPLNPQAGRKKSGPSTLHQGVPGASRSLPYAHESPVQPEERSPHQGMRDQFPGDHDPAPRHHEGERDQHWSKQTHQKLRESKRTSQRPFIENRRKIEELAALSANTACTAPAQRQGQGLLTSHG